ncbi:hypothetical protein JW960_22925 [candidate division KSB1 bacterium]|nr:hypothetical protein [candidate division KSB1 bacterium]
MKDFQVNDFHIVDELELPLSTIKRQIGNMLESSLDCIAVVESVDKDTGEYKIVLKGKLLPTS